MSDSDFSGHVRRAAISNFVFNMLINGGLAWWLLRGNEFLTAWGAAAYGPDLLATGFLLSAAVAAIVMEINRRKAVREGSPPMPGFWEPLRAVSGRSRWGVCTAAGLIGLVLSALAVVVFASLATSLTVPVYASLKGLWAGMLAAAIVGPATVLGLERGAAERAVCRRETGQGPTTL
jgi:hypothetical protein